MDEQGTVEAKGGTVQKEGAPNFWDLVGTASPTKIYTAAPTLDWTTKFTSSPTLDWSESYTASPTMDFRNFLGTNAPTADWTLAKLIGTTAPTYDWTTFFDKPGSDSAASVDAASVTMSPAKVQAQGTSICAVVFMPDRSPSYDGPRHFSFLRGEVTLRFDARRLIIHMMLQPIIQPARPSVTSM
jgi:hypothetical protein